MQATTDAARDIVFLSKATPDAMPDDAEELDISTLGNFDVEDDE